MMARHGGHFDAVANKLLAYTLLASAVDRLRRTRNLTRLALLLHLSRDAQAINAVVNDPAVRPFVGAPEAGDLDLAPLVACDENLFPFGEHGGFALIWTAPHTREVHTFILKSGRGKWAREAAAEGIAMAAQAGTKALWTCIPDGQRHVAAYALGMGMEPTGETVERCGKPYSVMAMTCQ
jgi:hypothetical protein